MNYNDQRFIAEKIRTQYVEKENTEVDALVALDARVKRPANVLGYVTGAVGTLALGTGMSLVMTAPTMMAAGIVAGLAGIALIALSYPLYKRLLAKRRRRYAPEILRLSQEVTADAASECPESAENAED